MCKLLAIAAAVIMTGFTSAGEPRLARDLADVPFSLRQSNYTGRNGEGSCAHASIVTSLRYLSKDALADWWKTSHGDGATIYDSVAELTAAKVRFVYTDSGDVSLLEWATRNRLVVVLYHVPTGHCVNLVDFNQFQAVVLDNNSTQNYATYGRNEFLRLWLEQPGAPQFAYSGGWAIVIVGIPPPPYPIQRKK